MDGLITAYATCIAARGHGIGDGENWCTAEIMRRCKYYRTLRFRREQKSPVLAVFCFDGTRIGKDFQTSLQQHSWMWANSQSVSVKEVWLTHFCRIDETKTNMHPIFQYVHKQLERPEAKWIEVVDTQAVGATGKNRGTGQGDRARPSGGRRTLLVVAMWRWGCLGCR